MKLTFNWNKFFYISLAVILLINIPVLIYLTVFNQTLTRSVISLELSALEVNSTSRFNEFVKSEMEDLCNDSFYYMEGDNVVYGNCSDPISRKRLIKYAVYNFVMKHVEQVSDTYFEGLFLIENDPITTYEKGGDCENLAILAVSVLQSYNISGLYLLYQEEHMCWEADGVRFNCMPDEPILNLKYISTPEKKA